MTKSNCHTHTVYCDGKNTVKEMIESAVDKKFCSLGFSGHSPMNFNNEWAMNKEKLNSYISEIKNLKAEFKDRIDVLCGIELDADFCDVNLSEFDYVIGSMHQFRDGEKDYPIDLSANDLQSTVELLFSGSWLEMCKEYFLKLSEFICAVKPDVVGHFDLVTKYNEQGRFFDESDPAYQKFALDAVDKILSCVNGIIFEVNTGAMYRVGKSNPYPAPFIMKHLKDKSTKITITSDSHCTDSLDFAFDEAIEYCKSFGFEKSSIFTSGGIVEVDL